MLALRSLALAVGVMATQALIAPAALAQSASTTVAAAPRLTFTPDEMALARAASADPVLASFYGANGLRPVFSGDDGAKRGQALRRAIAAAPGHGLAPARYRMPDLDAPGLAGEIAQARALARYVLDLTGGMVAPASVDAQIHRVVQRPDAAAVMRRFVEHPDPDAVLADLAPRDPAYRQLQHALEKRMALLADADLPRIPEALWREGTRGQGVVALRQRLNSLGYEPLSDDPTVYDAELARAVAQFQAAAGLQADGVAGPNTIRRLNAGPGAEIRAILVALERLRWMAGQDPMARMVWVNIPEFSAQIREGGETRFTTRVVVGKSDPDLRTPEFSDQMEYVVVNPRWNVPRSITVKEYLPKLKANRYAVSHLDIIDGQGRVVPRDSIDFGRYTAANFPFRMRQKPSEDNALGLVKFIFPNPYNIYLHDTPSKHLFARSARAYSHGCVRIGDPFDLAYQLLSPQSDDPRGLFQAALASGQERWIALTPQVPVHLVYFTAFPDSQGRVRFHDDIYGRDAAVWAKLRQAGLDLAVGKD